MIECTDTESVFLKHMQLNLTKEIFQKKKKK